MPALSAIIDEYLAGHAHKAPSMVYTKGVHLRNLKKGLSRNAEYAADLIAQGDPEQYLQGRLKVTTPSPVEKERATIIHLFARSVTHRCLVESPAKALPAIKGEVKLPPFRTVVEIEDRIARVGFRPDEALESWDCL